MKRFLTLVIVLALCVCMVPVKIFGQSIVKSVVPSDVFDEIVSELSIYEQNKKFVDMEGVDFFDLDVSEKIFVYEYDELGFQEIAEAYLLFEDQEVVTLAYKTDNAPIQLMTDLGKWIESSNERKFAIVYDADGCHLYNGSGFKTLALVNETISDRNKVSDATDDEVSNLNLSTVDNTMHLPYVSNAIMARANGDYFCNVQYVPRTEDSLCWAACVAMIVNTIYDTNYTDVAIAMDKFSSSTNYRIELNFDETLEYMNNRFFLNYYNTWSLSSWDNVLYNNIVNGYPVIGGFRNMTREAPSHSCVIYGINIIAGRLVVKNPDIGTQTCYSINTIEPVNHIPSLTYYYTSSISGDTYLLIQALCKL